MLRLTTLRCLSSKTGNGAGEWAAHRTKQRFRLSPQALQQSRQRFQTQKRSYELQQSLNKQFGEQQKHMAGQRKNLEKAAYDLAMGNRKQRRQSENASHTYVRPQERAEQLATARHLLMLEEATRKEMKRGRGRRTEAFRAMKRN